MILTNRAVHTEARKFSFVKVFRQISSLKGVNSAHTNKEEVPQKWQHEPCVRGCAD